VLRGLRRRRRDLPLSLPARDRRARAGGRAGHGIRRCMATPGGPYAPVAARARGARAAHDLARRDRPVGRWPPSPCAGNDAREPHATRQAPGSGWGSPGNAAPGLRPAWRAPCFQGVPTTPAGPRRDLALWMVSARRLALLVGILGVLLEARVAGRPLA